MLLLSRQHCITQNDVQNKLQRSRVPLCNFLLAPVLSKTLRVIKLILRGRKLPSLIRKLQHLSGLFTAVKSQGDCVRGKGLFTSVCSNLTNHSFWQWPPGLRLNPDTSWQEVRVPVAGRCEAAGSLRAKPAGGDGVSVPACSLQGRGGRRERR